MPAQPIDPDVDIDAERSRGGGEFAVVAVVCVGGVIGAVARYEAQALWPTPPGTFPWSTFAINVVGCALMGILLVVVTEFLFGHRLLRPLLGTGVLGGFTTFSTYAADLERLLTTRHPGLAAVYLTSTVIAALVAVTTTARLTRLTIRTVRS